MRKNSDMSTVELEQTLQQFYKYFEDGYIFEIIS